MGVPNATGKRRMISERIRHMRTCWVWLIVVDGALDFWDKVGCLSSAWLAEFISGSFGVSWVFSLIPHWGVGVAGGRVEILRFH